MTMVEPAPPPHPADPYPASATIGAPAMPQGLAASQGTVIEQSRAVAEVQAMVIVAQERPRSRRLAIDEMREVCAMEQVANRAFYRFSRGDGMVTGPTVGLMRELARCWQNITHGVTELRRDDAQGISEWQAWAWDLQANYRVARVFIVPHRRDKGGKRVPLTTDRDVYEGGANQASRREREMIKAVLPPWFVEDAEDICRRTLEEGGGVPLARRITDAVGRYETLGVRVEQLVQKLDGRAADDWTPYDLAQLQIIWQSIHRRESTVDDEFPSPKVTAAEVRGQAAQMTPAAGQADPVEPRRVPRAATAKQLTAVNTLLGSKLGLTGDARFPRLTDMVGREITSTKDLTADEAGRLIEDLGALPDADTAGEGS